MPNNPTLTVDGVEYEVLGFGPPAPGDLILSHHSRPMSVVTASGNWKQYAPGHTRLILRRLEPLTAKGKDAAPGRIVPPPVGEVTRRERWSHIVTNDHLEILIDAGIELVEAAKGLHTISSGTDRDGSWKKIEQGSMAKLITATENYMMAQQPFVVETKKERYTTDGEMVIDTDDPLWRWPAQTIEGAEAFAAELNSLSKSLEGATG